MMGVLTQPAQVGDLLAGVSAAAVGVEDDLAGQLAP